MDYERVIERVVQVVESAGVAIMVIGGLVAMCIAVPALIRPATRPDAYQELRRNLGRVILLGLEVLIVGDIVRTVVVEPTLEAVVVLGSIVIIRIVLSFSLEVEIDGRWPWQEQRNEPRTPQ